MNEHKNKKENGYESQQVRHKIKAQIHEGYNVDDITENYLYMKVT